MLLLRVMIPCALLFLAGAFPIVLPTALSAQMLKFPMKYDRANKAFLLKTDDWQPLAAMPFCDDYDEKAPNRVIIKQVQSYGVLDWFGNLVVPLMYQKIDYCKNLTIGEPLHYPMPPLFVFQERHHFGLLDINGIVLAPAVYEETFRSSWYNGIAVVKREGRYGFLDTNGVEIVPPTYQAKGRHTKSGRIWMKRDNLWGICDARGKEHTAFLYDSVQVYVGRENQWAMVRNEQGKWGLVASSTGTVVVPCEYEDMRLVADKPTSVSVRRNALWGMIKITETSSSSSSYSSTAALVVPIQCDKPLEAQNHDADWVSNYFQAQQRGKWGVVDSLGRIVFPFRFDAPVEQAWSSFTTKIGTSAVLINKNGEPITPLGYTELEFAMNYVTKQQYIWTAISTGGSQRKGLMTTSGTVLIEPQFSTVLDDSNNDRGYVAVAGNPKGAILNMATGKFITEFIYDDPKKGKADTFFWWNKRNKAKNVSVAQNNLFGVVDSTGKEILPCAYTKLRMLSSGAIIATHPNELLSVFSPTGECWHKEKFTEMWSYTEHESLVKQGSKWGIMSDSTGMMIVSPRYDSIVRLSNRPFCYAQRDGKWLLFDTRTQREVTPPKYDEIVEQTQYHYTVTTMPLVPMRVGDKWGILSLDSAEAGKEVIPPQYDAMGSADDGYACVRRGKYYGVISLYADELGKEVVPIEYEAAMDLETNREKKEYTVCLVKNGVTQHSILPYRLPKKK